MPIHYNSDKTFFYTTMSAILPLLTKPVINKGGRPTWNLKKSSLLDMQNFFSSLRYFQFLDGTDGSGINNNEWVVQLLQPRNNWKKLFGRKKAAWRSIRSSRQFNFAVHYIRKNFAIGYPGRKAWKNYLDQTVCAILL